MSMNCPGGTLYVIKSGDTFYAIASRNGISVADLEKANPGVNPTKLQIGQTICIPPVSSTCKGFMYTIKQGDTLYNIAKTYGTTVEAIVKANPNINPNNLQIGQVICIPVEPALVPQPVVKRLTPTDLMPNSKGMIFVETDLGSVVGLVTNVPDPTVLPGGEVYKLWVKKPGAATYSVTTMSECMTAYWVGRVLPGSPLTGASVIISAEKKSNTTAPTGIAVSTGTI